MEKLIVSSAEINMRLDTFLVQKIKSVTRSKIQKSIKTGEITVNEKSVSPHYKVKEGQVVIFSIPKNNKIGLKPVNRQSYRVVDEDDDYLIIDKPAGLLVHPDGIHDEVTLINELLYKYPKIKLVGDNQIRPGIVHRLDREASGVMVVAKNSITYDHLKTQFQKRLVKKEYYAVVYGTPDKNSGEITFSIIRSRHHPNRMAARPDKSGRQAYTSYVVVKNLNNKSLLRISTKTGRTHQVRVHLFAINHPIVGDNIYYPKSKRRAVIDRLLLHAHYLEFKDHHGVVRKYSCPPPAPEELWLNP
ncbi:RluA family pseudouridine synthase [Patescibacteria group bacterium]